MHIEPAACGCVLPHIYISDDKLNAIWKTISILAQLASKKTCFKRKENDNTPQFSSNSGDSNFHNFCDKSLNN